MKIVLSLDPPFVVDPEDEATWVVSSEVDPSAWFEMDGGMVDLGSLDLDQTGEVHPLEVQFEDELTKMENRG